MAIIIQHRNDTAINWTTVNPILAQGEIGIETDTRLQKVGNGVLAWNDLEYYTYGGASALLPTGGYIGTAQNLNSDISARTEKGTYSGTAGQLKAMIDSLATAGTITPDLKNYMELVKNENEVKVVQGVPVGGQKSLGTFTGAPKIKIPSRREDTKYKFKVSFFTTGGGRTDQVLAEIVLTGRNSTDFLTSQTANEHRAMIFSQNPNFFNKKLYFCTGEIDDYLIIGETTDYYVGLRVVISEVQALSSSVADWSKGWDISYVNELENLTEGTTKVTVIPSLNATHINSTMTSNAQGGITQKKTSTMALEVENDAGTTFFNVNTTIGKVTERLSSSVTPANNNEMEFQLTSNTQLTIKVKGTDGVVRSANITLS